MSASRQERSFIDNHHRRSKYFRTCDQGVESPLDDGNESSDDLPCPPRQRTSSASAPCPKIASRRCQAIVYDHLTGPAPWAWQLVHHKPAFGSGGAPEPLSRSGLRNDRSYLRKHLVAR